MPQKSISQVINNFGEEYSGDKMRQFALLLEQRLNMKPLPRFRRTEVSGATYVVQRIDEFLAVTRTTTGSCTITLPMASAFIDTDLTKVLRIKDEGLNASANPITLTPDGAEQIEGGASHVINTDGGGVTLYSNGTDWFILF